MVSILTSIERYYEFKTPVIWTNVFFMALAHILAIYAITLFPTANYGSLLWAAFCTVAGDIGLSIGAHRLWTHRSYKAKLPMRILAMLFYMLAGQYSIVQWTRDHRTHHKYSDTDADPHNAARGLFFSHIGWLMMKRHPEVKEKGKLIDVSDVWQDPVVRFHQKHFILLLLVIHVIIPSAFAYYVIGESLKNAVFINFFFRYMISLNLVWCLNSFAHYSGYKPYNKNTRACNNPYLAFILGGEGYHNFHHTFPWDYRIGEDNQPYKVATRVIVAFARYNLAYDLKTASPELIQKVLAKQDLPVNYEVPETGLIDKQETIQNKVKVA